MISDRWNIPVISFSSSVNTTVASGIPCGCKAIGFCSIKYNIIYNPGKWAKLQAIVGCILAFPGVTM